MEIDTDEIEKVTKDSQGMVKSFRWPAVFLLLGILYIFSPMIMGEFHGQIPGGIEAQQNARENPTVHRENSNETRLEIGQGYNVVYSQDVVFLRLLIDSVKSNSVVSGVVLAGVFLIIFACTPLTRSLIDNWGKNIRNDRRCQQEEANHSRTCEKEELPEKLKHEKEESDAQRSHEQALADKRNTNENIQREHEKQMATDKQTHERKLQAEKLTKQSEEDASQRAHEVVMQDKKNQREKDRESHKLQMKNLENESVRLRNEGIQSQRNTGKVIRIRILKKGFVDENGYSHGVGSEHIVTPEVANPLINNGIAEYAAEKKE